MASITRRGDGYTVRWRDRAGCAHSRQCPDKRTAEQLRAEIIRAHALGGDWSPAPLARAAPSVADAMQAYLDDRARVWSPATARPRFYRLDAFVRWAEGEGADTVADLSRDLLARYHGHLRATCAELAAGQTVRAVETWWSWLLDHDDYASSTPRLRRLEMPDAAPVLDPIAPTWAEMDAAIGACSTDWHRRLLVVGRCAGLRPGQILRLDWRDVDLDGVTLRIRPDLGKSKQERRGRTVPIAPALLREIETWAPREGRLVPAAPSGIDYDTWHRIWERAGVRPAVWRQPAHTLRKGFKSGLLTAGASWVAVEYLMGHALGIGGVYTDPAAMGLKAAVAHVPAITRTVLRLRG